MFFFFFVDFPYIKFWYRLTKYSVLMKGLGGKSIFGVKVLHLLGGDSRRDYRRR